MIKLLSLIFCLSICALLYAQPVDQSSDNKKSKDFSTKESTYLGFAELGYTSGIGNYGMNVLKFNIINGYRINPNLSFGIGTGVRYFLDFEATVIPLFADFRANFINKKFSPYMAVNAGYAFNVTGGFNGIGALVNPSAGVSMRLPDKSMINFGIGYEMQRLKLYHNLTSINVNTGGLSFVLGFSF